MTQKEKRIYLIEELLKEQTIKTDIKIPENVQEQKNLLRSLFNIRAPKNIRSSFLAVQDAYLQEETKQKGITNLAELTPVQEGIYLWQGDIITFRCDAIVNAANSQMLGCFCPCHGCIDNAIHTFSGVQLRLTCSEIMEKQGHEEHTGTAKITPAYNLPCKYILHTVGPVIRGRLTEKDKGLLACCYHWSRYIYINRYMDTPKPVYRELYDLVRNKDYFVLTTNVDYCFQKAGFDKKRLFYTQGDYGLFQCSEPCCSETFENESMIRNMMEQQKDMHIPTELLPVCPHCGKPLTMNLRADSRFVEDEGWHKAAERYELFLRRHNNMQVLFLELGVGYNTPGIVKYPFWQMTAENPKAIYACVNLGEACAPTEIIGRSICINADIGEVLKQL